MTTNANIAVYACDSMKNGSEIGPETKARCDKAIDLIIDLGLKRNQVILGAGKDPNFPDSPPLKRLMANYLQSALRKKFQEKDANYNWHLYINIVGTDSVWGTFKETKAMVSSLKKYDRPEDLYVVTSKYHMRRVLYIWNALDPDMKIIPAPVDFDPGYLNKLREYPAMIKAYCNVMLES